MLLTVKDLQSILGIGRDTAYALMHSQAFPAMKIGRRYFVSKDVLYDWIAKHTYKSFQL